MSVQTQNTNLNPYSNTPIKNLEYIQNKALVIAPFEITKSGLIDTDIMLDTPGFITMYFFRKNFNSVLKEPTAEQFKVVGTVPDISTKLGLDITASNISSSSSSSYYLGSTKIAVIFKYDKNTGIRTIEKDTSLLVGDYTDISIDSTCDLTAEDYFVICNVTKNIKATNTSFTESSSMDFLFMIPSDECQELITDFDILDTNNKTINIKKYGTLGSGFVADNDTTFEPAYQADFFGDGSNIATYLFDGTCRDLNGNYNGAPTDITYGEGKFGQAAVFNGTSSIINLGGVIFPDSINISFFLFTKIIRDQVFLDLGDGRLIYIYQSLSGDKRLRVQYSATKNSHVSSTQELSDNTLYHISANISKTSATLYLDSSTQTRVAWNNYLNTKGTTIGGRSDNILFSSCKISNFRIFNRALNQNEVTALYLNNASTRVIKQESIPQLSQKIDIIGDGSNTSTFLFANNPNDSKGLYTGTATSLTYDYGRNKLGYSAKFAAGSRFVIGYTPWALTDFSMSFWFKPTINGADQFLYSEDTDNWYVTGYNGSGYLCVRFGTGSNWTVTTTKLTTGAWYNFILVKIGGTGYAYLNGNLVLSMTFNSFSTQRIAFGSSSTFVGNIAEVRLYNKALSRTEINNISRDSWILDNPLLTKPDFFKDGSNIYTYPFNGDCKDLITGASITSTNQNYDIDRFNNPKGCLNLTNPNVSQYILPFYPATNSSPYSISGWFYFETSGSNTGTNSILYIRAGTDLVITGNYSNGNITLSVGLSSGGQVLTATNDYRKKWNHITTTYDGGNTILFINGIKIGSITGTMNVGTWNNLIGSSQNYIFKIDSLRIFNRALNQREVLELYNEQPSYEEQLTLTEVTGKTLTPGGNPLIRYDRDNGPATVFDGASYYSTPATNDFAFGTGDFTVETWLKFNLTPGGSSRYFCILDTVGGIGFGYESSTLAFGTRSTAFEINYAWTPTVGTWYHLAVTRENGLMKLWINGTKVKELTNTKNLSINTGTFYIGAINSTTAQFQGSISQLHIIKGQAKYTSNFTPASRLLQTANTVLLLQVDKPVINTDNWSKVQLESVEAIPTPSIIEQTGKSLINSGMTTVNDTYKNNDGALLCAQNKSISLASTSDLVLGTNDFTIELWCKWNGTTPITGTTQYTMFNNLLSGSNKCWDIQYYNGAYRFSPYTSGWGLTFTKAMDNNWHHIAIEKYNNTLTMYFDGVTAASSTTLPNLSDTSMLYIGNTSYTSAENAWNGYLDDIRITNGRARYQKDFTPPTTSLVKDTNTVFLLQAKYPNIQIKDPKRKDFFGDKSLVACYMLDSNANDETGLYNGILNGNNFIASTGKFGQCVSVNGTNYVDLPETLSSLFGTNDFSISLWFKPSGTFVTNNIIFATQSSNSPGFFNLLINSNNKISVSLFDGGSRPGISHQDNINLTDWNHVVVTKKSNVYTIYSNNVISGSTLTNALSIACTDIRLGQNPAAPTGEYFSGQLNNVKIFNRALTASEVTSLYNEVVSPIITLETETETIASEPDFFNDKSNIATYLFDNNVNDANGKYNGTATNIVYTDGKFGKCANFDGNTYINFNDSSIYNFSSVKSISLWFKTNTNNTYSTLMCYKGGTGYLDKAIIALTQGKLYFDGTSIVSNTLYNDDKWHHVVITLLSGSSYNWYIDGIFTATKVHTSLDVSYIGCDGATPNEYYTGQMDNLRFFNRPLTASEVQDLYRETKRVKYKAITLDKTNFGPAAKFGIETQKEIKLLNYKTWIGTDATSQGYRIYPVMKISDHTTEETSFSPKYYLGAKYQRNLAEVLLPALKSKRTISNLKDMYLVDDLCIQTLKKINILLENNQLIKFTDRLYQNGIREKINAEVILDYISTPVTGTSDNDINSILKTSLISDYGFTQDEIDNLNANLNTFRSRARIALPTPTIQGTNGSLDQVKFTLPKTFVDGNRSKTEKKNLLVFGTDAGFNKFSLNGYSAPYSNISKRDATSALVYSDLVSSCPVLSKENSTKGSILIDEYTKLLIYNGLDNKVGSIPVGANNITLTNTVTKTFANSIDFTAAVASTRRDFAFPKSNDFIFGTNDFSIETMVYLKTMPTSNTTSYSGGAWAGLSLIFGANINTNDTYFAIGSTNIVCQINGTQVLSPSAHGMVTNTWYKINISRVSGALSFSINDVSIGSVTNSTSITYGNISTTSICIGCYYMSNINYMQLNGYMDYIKVTNGITISKQYTNLNTFKDFLTNYKQQLPITYIPLSTDITEPGATVSKPVFENLIDITGFDHSEIIIDLPNVL